MINAAGRGASRVYKPSLCGHRPRCRLDKHKEEIFQSTGKIIKNLIVHHEDLKVSRSSKERVTTEHGRCKKKARSTREHAHVHLSEGCQGRGSEGHGTTALAPKQYGGTLAPNRAWICLYGCDIFQQIVKRLRFLNVIAPHLKICRGICERCLLYSSDGQMASLYGIVSQVQKRWA